MDLIVWFLFLNEILGRSEENAFVFRHIQSCVETVLGKIRRVPLSTLHTGNSNHLKPHWDLPLLAKL
jgi:hypothetical protein